MKSERRKRQGIMLAHTLTDKRLADWPEMIIAQPKLNGLRCRVVITTSPNFPKHPRAHLFSSTGLQFTSMPHIERALVEQLIYTESITEKRSLTFDGELYKHGWSIQKISGIVRRQQPTKESAEIGLRLYDTMNTVGQIRRLGFLTNAFEWKAPLTKVAPCFVKKLEWKAQCAEYLEEGYEGIILRHPDGLYETKRSKYLLKYKPIYKNYYIIKGVFQAVDKYSRSRGIAGGLFLEDKKGNKFSSGMGTFPFNKRESIWRRWDVGKVFPGKYALIKYPELTDRGVPFQPILIDVVNILPEEITNGDK